VERQGSDVQRLVRVREEVAEAGAVKPLHLGAVVRVTRDVREHAVQALLGSAVDDDCRLRNLRAGRLRELEATNLSAVLLAKNSGLTVQECINDLLSGERVGVLRGGEVQSSHDVLLSDEAGGLPTDDPQRTRLWERTQPLSGCFQLSLLRR